MAANSIVVDCGKPENITPVINHISQRTGLKPAQRQDGQFLADFCYACGTRFLRFFNVPERYLKDLRDAIQEATQNLEFPEQSQ